MPGGGTQPETSTILRGLGVLFDVDAGKARLFEPGQVVIENECPTDAADQGFHVLTDGGRRLGSPCHIGNCQAPAGLQDAVNFSERPILVGNQIENAVANRDVNGGVIDRQGLDIAFAEFDVVKA